MPKIPTVVRTRRPVHLVEPLESRCLLSAALAVNLVNISSVPFNSTLGPVATVPVVTEIPLTIRPVTQTPFSGDVGEIRGLSPTLLPRLKAFINWGDNPTATSTTTADSTGVLSFDSAGLLHVRGTHTYETAGNFPVTVSVLLSPPPGSLGPTQLFTINSKAIVTGNSAGGVTLHETAKIPFTATVGFFNIPPSSVANPVVPVVQALINWGDGTASVGTILALPAGGSSGGFSYAVQGTHTYATPATYPIVIAVDEQNPPPPTPVPVATANPLWVQLITTIQSTAIVTAPITATG